MALWSVRHWRAIRALKEDRSKAVLRYGKMAADTRARKADRSEFESLMFMR